MTNPLTLTQIPQPLRWCVQRLSKLDVLRDWYDEWMANHDGKGHSDFLNYTLEKTGVKWSVSNEQALSQTREGEPLIVVANHPLGGLEGMFLSQLLLKYRSDVKVLTNHMLLEFKEFNQLFIGVDVLNPNKKAENARGVRAISRHLGNGGALLIFPSGTVSHASNGELVDPPWNPMVGHLALKYQAQCLSIHVGGRNHWSFYQSAKIHPRLRTMLIPRAMISKVGDIIPVVVGNITEFDRSEHSPQSVTDYLRISSELLKPDDNNDPDNTDGSASSDKKIIAVAENLEHIEHPNRECLIDKSACANDSKIRKETYLSSSLLQNLDEQQPFLVREKNGFHVYCLPFAKLGWLAKALAEARAKTFHAVGEGTELDEDSDRFDRDYWHIVVWDTGQQRLVGGYRAANAQALVARHGLQALYSFSLFHYDRRFLDSLGGAIEVGRSFVSSEYQSNPFALDLLWHGLGHFMNMHPDCHTFFGCVSISQRYAPVARALIVDALLEEHGATEAQRQLVKPISPFRYRHRFWSADLLAGLANITAINKLLGKAHYQCRVPMLIRHYVSLNGKFVDFSINRGFSNSLDGLIYVDLREAPIRYIKRYLGVGVQQFCVKWNVLEKKEGTSKNAA